MSAKSADCILVEYIQGSYFLKNQGKPENDMNLVIDQGKIRKFSAKKIRKLTKS